MFLSPLSPFLLQEHEARANLSPPVADPGCLRAHVGALPRPAHAREVFQQGRDSGARLSVPLSVGPHAQPFEVIKVLK